MTDRITQNKQDRVSEVIEQLNKELHPLVVKAVLIDPMMAKTLLTTEAHLTMLKKVLILIQELITLVKGEQ